MSLTDAYTERRVEGGGVVLYIPYRCVHSETCRRGWCGAISLTDAYTARRVDGGGVVLYPSPIRTQQDV